MKHQGTAIIVTTALAVSLGCTKKPERATFSAQVTYVVTNGHVHIVDATTCFDRHPRLLRVFTLAYVDTFNERLDDNHSLISWEQTYEGDVAAFGSTCALKDFVEFKARTGFRTRTDQSLDEAIAETKQRSGVSESPNQVPEDSTRKLADPQH